MKLSRDIKNKIDKYFDNITSEELYDIAINKYSFKDNVNIDLDNQSFHVIKQNYYSSTLDNRVDVGNPHDTTPLAA